MARPFNISSASAKSFLKAGLSSPLLNWPLTHTSAHEAARNCARGLAVMHCMLQRYMLGGKRDGNAWSREGRKHEGIGSRAACMEERPLSRQLVCVDC